MGEIAFYNKKLRFNFMLKASIRKINCQPSPVPRCSILLRCPRAVWGGDCDTSPRR